MAAAKPPRTSASSLPDRPPPVLSVRLRVLRGKEVGLGPGKAELLAAVAETGSITGAAQHLKISYMHAWSLVQTMNGCFRAPLVRSSRGGQRGGGAGLTDAGREVLAIYREMTAEATRVAQAGWERLQPWLRMEGEGEFPLALSTAEDDDSDLMEQSIRNELPGIIKEIISDRVLSEVIVETAIGEMAAVITTRSVQEMGLKVGDRVAALVKATNVSVRRQHD
jgi:molybdate transport system regulatory protein